MSDPTAPLGPSPDGSTRRVLFATDHTELSGKVPHMLVDLVDALTAEPGIECVVTTPGDGQLVDRFADAGIRTALVPTPRWVVADLHSPLRVPRSHRTVLRMASRATPPWLRLLRHLRPDTVVTTTSFLPTPALAARSLGIDHVWWVTEVMRQHPDHRYALGVAQTAAAIDHLSRRIVVPSTVVADSLTGVPRTRLRVVPPASTIPRRDEPAPDRPPGAPLRVLLVDEFEPGRGAETAIVATDRARRAGAAVELRLLGPAHPYYSARLARQAAESPSRDHIGWLPPDQDQDLATCFDQFDVVLLPAAVEAHGRLGRAALRRGRPVVAASSSALVEVVEDGHSGLLFPPDDVNALATLLVRLAGDPDEVERLTRGAWEAGSRALPIEQTARLFRAVLEEGDPIPDTEAAEPAVAHG